MMNDETTVASCVKNVCENQGTCLQMKNSFKCLCKYGFFGGTCQLGKFQRIV